MEINFAKLEKKWQNKWEKEKVFEVDMDSKKKKFYCLEMFPYPSSQGLHMGHALNFAMGDILARYKRMQGFNVLYPMGFDALGLPAENAAIKANKHPKPFTQNAEKNYIRQMKELGLSYDWSKTLTTMSPEYYKWDQYFFLKFYKAGLIYQKKAPVNWCPKCNTVLANEQVQGGKCWRHEDTNIDIKHLNQWYLKTTKYADELLKDLEKIDWPEKIKTMQKNWIGKSHGTEINFKINNETWPIFTTRPDTIYGVTFMVVSAAHEKLIDLVTPKQQPEIKKFLKEVNSVSEKDLANLEKKGVFTGSYAINPITNEKIPVYAGNFVVADYGSGMVMAVPAHDQRDFEFAKKYKIEIEVVIKNPNSKEIEITRTKTGNITRTKELDKAYTGNGNLIASEQFSGMDNENAKKEITKYLTQKKLGKKQIQYKLRDWGFSRQRYWGAPIPIINCKTCGIVAVPEKDLPIILPEKVTFGKGNPLTTNKEWIRTKCPKCNGEAKRETETMDTFFDSSWYFLRYPDNKNSKKPFDKKIINEWLPADQYIGGAEHACMHLIYARFFTKALRDLKFLDFDEPFSALFNQGMLHGPDGEKMSKSKGNIINPDDISAKYGMDTARYFLFSIAETEKDRDWSEDGIKSALKFINKILNTYKEVEKGKSSQKYETLLNKTIIGVTKDIEEFKYRKATIKLKELFDALAKEKSVSRETLEKSLQLLNPICPHITEELWEKLGNKDFICKSVWPKAKKTQKNTKKENITEKLISQINQLLEKVKDKENLFIYVMPFELEKIDLKKISSKINKKIKIFATNNKEKYDPENKSKKAKPGMPSIYLE